MYVSSDGTAIITPTGGEKLNLMNVLEMSSSVVACAQDMVLATGKRVYVESSPTGYNRTTLQQTTTSAFESIFDSDNWKMVNHRQSTGGWARNVMIMEDDSGTEYFMIGAFGNGQSCYYGYLGTAYNNCLLKWSTGNTYDAAHRLGIGISGSTRPSELLDIAGHLTVDASGNVETDGTMQSAGYKSSTGTAGATADVDVAKVGGGTRTLHFENGLYTGYTDS
jgi:hypothetical protein